MNLLTIIPAEGEGSNAADSAKVAIHNMAEQIASDPNAFLQDLGQKALDFGLKILAAVVIYAVGAWIIKRIKIVMTKFFRKKNTEPTISSFVISLTTISLTVLLIVITIGTLGVNTTSFAALLAAGGMAIGMALSGTVQNFAGGLMILLFKPFKVGDFIKAQGYEGTVTDVSIVSTKIRTGAGSTIILPNGALFNGNIDNFSEKPLHRCDWAVNVAYGTDTRKACEVLLDILKSDSRTLNAKTSGAADPAAFVNALKDSSVELVARAWVHTDEYWTVLHDINQRIYTELPEQGVQFPFPQLDIHIKDKS